MLAALVVLAAGVSVQSQEKPSGQTSKEQVLSEEEQALKEWLFTQRVQGLEKRIFTGINPFSIYEQYIHAGSTAMYLAAGQGRVDLCVCSRKKD